MPGTWRPLGLFVAALTLALVVFGPALSGTFVFDDSHLPFADPRAASMPPGFWIGGVRPALMATYWVNFLISGTRPFSYHLVNVALHAGTAVLMYRIFERLLTIASVARYRRRYALIGSAIFLLHPLQTESVDYIAGRSELLAGFFFAAAWLVFLNHFDSETGYATSLKIIFLASIAMLSKESSISIPAVLLATDLFWAKEGIARQLRLRIRLYVLFGCGALLAVGLVLRSLSSGTSAGFGAAVRPVDYALTQCRAVFIYIRLFFYPKGQNSDWMLPFFHSLKDNWAWAYCAGILALMAVIIYLFRRDRLISFGLLIFFLMLLPTSSFVPIQDALAERRTYMPIAGLILAVFGFLARVRLKAGPLNALAVAALAVLSIASWRRSTVWTSELNLWVDSVRKNPANPRAHFGLGSALVMGGNCGSAVHEFVTAYSQGYPEQQKVEWNLAEAYKCENKLDLALPLYELVAKRQPSAEAYNRIGYVEAMRGDAGAAIAAFNTAIKLDPGNAAAYAYRGTAKLAVTDIPGAEEDFHRALNLDPASQIALEGMRNLAKAGK